MLSTVALGAVVLTASSSCGQEVEKPDYSNVANRIIADSIAVTEIPQKEFAMSADTGSYTSSDKVNKILFSDGGAEISGDGALFEDNCLKINKGGTYVLTGSLMNGGITVSLDPADKNKLCMILNGVNINCTDGPALNIENSPKKVMVYTADSSVNILCGKENPDIETVENACIYSSSDIAFDGKGELYITSGTAKGIHSKDDVDISGGRIYVCSADDGVQGNDNVKISGGYLYIRSEGDGIKTTSTKGGKGNISISDGELYIKSAFDGIQAQNNFSFSGGRISIKCADGVTVRENKDDESDSTDNDSQKDTHPFDDGMPQEPIKDNNTKPQYSCKGIKAENIIKLTGGHLCINTPDSALHAGNAAEIDGVELLVYSGNNGVFANTCLTVNGGILQIRESKEGLESKKITINDGYINIRSSDDGFNAYGGYSEEYGDGSTQENQSKKKGVVNDNPEVIINGGTVIINADGDGIDSNGNIFMNGGFVAIFGPTSGTDSAIDYGDGNNSMTISGGTLIALGSSEMAKTAIGDGQGVIAFSCKGKADVMLTVADSSGNTVFSLRPPKKYKSVVFSCEKMKKGETYKIYSGGNHSGVASDCIYDIGTVDDSTEIGELKAR